jgi:adenylosuccinate synthase
MQRVGEQLDKKTRGKWVCDDVIAQLGSNDREEVILIDAVRIDDQIHRFREAFGPKVIHIHLTADEICLRKRYARRASRFKEFPKYEHVRRSKTERNVSGLAPIADVVIETDKCTELDVAVRAASHLGVFSRALTPMVDVLIGGQYGSEGKGNIAAHLAPDYDYLVRVGGPNAGHKVFADPPYTFRHLPSGTQRTAAHLILGPGAIINVGVLLQEISDCAVTYDQLSIDPQALIIEPRDIRRERKRLGSISSTAQGVGEASARRINNRGVPEGTTGSVRLARVVRELTPYVRATSEVMERAYASASRILVEGTQGTGLSLYHGTYPYVTSRDTTVSGCLAQAGIAPTRLRNVVLVCRTYPIRVGGPSGPIGTEISLKEIARRSGLPYSQIRKTERTSTTNRRRRIAEFDWAQLRRSVHLNGPTDIALTFVDYLAAANQHARRFEQLESETINFVEEVERVSGAPVSLISTRFSYRNIIDRRSW